MADRMTDKETRFIAMTASYKEVIAKVCYIYVSPYASFDDLYQEVLINLWQGLTASVAKRNYPRGFIEQPSTPA